MVNGGPAEERLTSRLGSVVNDKPCGDLVQATISMPADSKKEIMGVVIAEKFVPSGDYDGEAGQEGDDAYCMDVSAESVTGEMLILNRSVMISGGTELDTNSHLNKDVTITSVINGSVSDLKIENERVSAEVYVVDAGVSRATASLDENFTDSNELAKLDVEMESEVALIKDARFTPDGRDGHVKAQDLEVLEAASAKTVPTIAEVVQKAEFWSNLDVNEPLKAVKNPEDLISDVTTFRVVEAEAADSLHGIDSRIDVSACGSSYTRVDAREFSQPVNYQKTVWEHSDRTEELCGSQGRLNAFKDIGMDSKNSLKGAKVVMTELEREIELYESSEREEQARLLEFLKGKNQWGEQSELQNDKKRSLELPMQRRESKLSRRMHTAEEIKSDEEDVCFICFDGGDLVLCDRRSCPKAYHLSCIGRDAAFFKKKGAWLCGWHFCSVCTKPGSFQCYSCPTAYCGNCIAQAEFFLLRKRKGLCEDCLPIVSMIERNETINADGVEVDFEDQETYECLFKEYWKDLKRRLSLVMPELDKDGKPMGKNGSILTHVDLEMEDHTENDDTDKDTDESDHDYSESLGAAWKKRNPRNRTGVEEMDEHLDPECKDEKEGEEDQELLQVLRFQKLASWASAELLDFIEHMKEDPTRPLSRFAVNKLLWSYIKRHKLQDPRKSSQINCDERLKRIFGKQSVGQFEMFKQLQIHFPGGGYGDGKKSKDAQLDDAMDEDHVDGTAGNEDKLGTGGAKERRRGRRPTDERFERPNSTEFAAITPKNMDLIYLRRALLRDMLDDPEFDNKVVDTFVRIRVPGISSKTETTYRLVLVTGTRIGEDSYKAGTKTTNIVLEILNLQKKEDVTVDLVSNQDFTEEECQRLRQSIKCGFIKALTVGQVEEKAIALREAKVNDWFESEKQRLINLRDRASEKGRKKELRECVEKLQELSSPAFRAAKLQARPEVTSDPHMDPGYESDLNEISTHQGGTQKFHLKLSPNDDPEKTAGSEFNTSDALDPDESFHVRGDYAHHRSKNAWEDHGRRGYCRVGYDGGRSSEKLGAGRDSVLGIDGKSHSNDGRDKARVWDKDWEKYQARDQDRIRGVGYIWNNNGGRIDVIPWAGEVDDPKFCRGEARAGSTPVFGQTRPECGREVVSSAPLSGSTVGYGVRSPIVRSMVISEKEKLWHYQDPTGMVQGPFTMEQLRKWNTTGLFPAYLTVWKTGDVQENSVLLNDALAGRFKETLISLRNMSRDTIAGGSSTPRCSSSWGTGDAGHSASRAEVGQSVSTTDWDPRNAVERGGNWARSQSSFGSPSSTGRGDDLSSSRSRADSDMWITSRKVADMCGWGDGESGKSTYGRSTSSREYDTPAGRDGSRSARGLRALKKDVPCRFYAKGYCKRGETCEFWHG